MTIDNDMHSALLWIQVENCRSYRDKTDLDLGATRISIPEVVRSASSDSKGKKVEFLPVVGIFGANASGKSALVQAITDFRGIVVNSFRNATEGGSIQRIPFLLDDVSKESNTSFAIELLLDGVRCEYGLEVTDEEVISEYFFYYPNGAKALVFEREGNKYKFGKKFELPKDTRKMLRANTALLSFAGAFEWSLPSRLFSWFHNEIMLVDENTRRLALQKTAKYAAKDSAKRQLVLDLLFAADLGITDIASEPPPKELLYRIRKMLKTFSPEEEVESIVADAVFFTHCGDTCRRLDTSQESLGTVTWAGLIYPIVEALEQGSVLLVDELDTSLHPLLVHSVIEIFQNAEINPRHAQLIFNAHDITVFSASDQSLLGRDQVWFAEKDSSSGASTLCSLAEYKPRKDETIQPRYLGGRYGALPMVDKLKVRQAMKKLHVHD